MIRINEVLMRDGLQIEEHFVARNDKVRMVDELSKCGYSKIEVSSFVSPKAVPNLRDAGEVFQDIKRHSDVTYVALIPNLHGAKNAANAKVDEVNLVMSASATHNIKNVNKSNEESLKEFKDIIDYLKGTNIKVNGSIATSFGCPFEGSIDRNLLFKYVENYIKMGMHSITLADTTGMANPNQVSSIVRQYKKNYDSTPLTLHFHNTRGMGLANVIAAIDAGAESFDASLGGIGGCPFAPGATGNICTEDTVHMLSEMGIKTNVNLDRIIELSKHLPVLLNRKDIPGQIIKSGKVSDLHLP